SRRRHTRSKRDWSSDVCSSDLDKNGTPLCNAGRPMVPNGQDRSTGYLMWRCPFGKDHVSKCPQNCSNAKYGRVIKTRPEWDIRRSEERRVGKEGTSGEARSRYE